VHTLEHVGELRHTAFLDLSGNDPPEPFAKALIAACGDTGPVFVYNGAFEMTRISELAERYPDLAEALLAINARVVDLLPIARNRYYHPQPVWALEHQGGVARRRAGAAIARCHLHSEGQKLPR